MRAISSVFMCLWLGLWSADLLATRTKLSQRKRAYNQLALSLLPVQAVRGTASTEVISDADLASHAAKRQGRPAFAIGGDGVVWISLNGEAAEGVANAPKGYGETLALVFRRALEQQQPRQLKKVAGLDNRVLWPPRPGADRSWVAEFLSQPSLPILIDTPAGFGKLNPAGYPGFSGESASAEALEMAQAHGRVVIAMRDAIAHAFGGSENAGRVPGQGSYYVALPSDNRQDRGVDAVLNRHTKRMQRLGINAANNPLFEVMQAKASR